MSSTSKPFNFFVPIDLVKASESSEAQSVLRIGGIASTRDRDTDGEVLETSGFELDFFKNYGFINYNHKAKTDPSAIVGEPVLAEIRPEGLYIEVDLYPESPLAVGIYNLIKILKKRKSKRRLGFSIEGKVLEVDILDKTRIKRARVTGCAITPTPKNMNTLADVIKGELGDTPLSFESLEEEVNSPNGGTETLLDVLTPYGTSITIDKEWNIKIGKGLDTASGAALMKESVEPHIKFIQNEDQQKLEKSWNSNAITATFMTDLDIFKGCLTFSDNNIEKADQFFTAIQAMNKKPISPEELNAALDVLKLAPIELPIIEKAADSEQMKKEEPEDDDDMDDEEYEITKARMEKYEMKKKSSHMDIKKGEESTLENTSSEGELVKGLLTAFQGVVQRIDALTTITKAVQESQTDVVRNQYDLAEKVEELENMPPQRKSITSGIEKSFDPDLEKSLADKGIKTLSLSKNRREVQSFLRDNSGLEKGSTGALDQNFCDAIQQLEASGSIDPTLLKHFFTTKQVAIIA